MPFTSTPVPEIVNDSTRITSFKISKSKVAPLLIVVPDGLFPRAFSFLIEIVPYLIVVVPLYVLALLKDKVSSDDPDLTIEPVPELLFSYLTL